MDRELMSKYHFIGKDGEVHDGEMYAEERVAEAVKQERMLWIDAGDRLIADNRLAVGVFADLVRDTRYSRKPGPTKLEKLEWPETMDVVTARAWTKIDALVDATNANTEAILRLGGKA